MTSVRRLRGKPTRKRKYDVAAHLRQIRYTRRFLRLEKRTSAAERPLITFTIGYYTVSTRPRCACSENFLSLSLSLVRARSFSVLASTIARFPEMRKDSATPICAFRFTLDRKSLFFRRGDQNARMTRSSRSTRSSDRREDEPRFG